MQRKILHFDLLMRKLVWRETLFLTYSLPWCDLGSSNTTSLPVPGQEDMDGKVKAEEAIPRLPPHRFFLWRGRNLLFQEICGLLNPKRYKGTESHRDGETQAAIVAVCRILHSSSYANLCQAHCMLLCSHCYHGLSLSPVLLGMSYS